MSTCGELPFDWHYREQFKNGTPATRSQHLEVKRDNTESILQPTVQPTTHKNYRKFPVVVDGKEIFYECPHCGGEIVTNTKDIACGIFRHGAAKKTGAQIDPHSSKQICDALSFQNELYGCGKPYQLTLDAGKYFVSECDYV